MESDDFIHHNKRFLCSNKYVDLVQNPVALLVCEFSLVTSFLGNSFYFCDL